MLLTSELATALYWVALSLLPYELGEDTADPANSTATEPAPVDGSSERVRYVLVALQRRTVGRRLGLVARDLVDPAGVRVAGQDDRVVDSIVGKADRSARDGIRMTTHWLTMRWR